MGPPLFMFVHQRPGALRVCGGGCNDRHGCGRVRNAPQPLFDPGTQKILRSPIIVTIVTLCRKCMDVYSMYMDV